MLSTAPLSITHITLDLRIVHQRGTEAIPGEDVLRQLDWTAFDKSLRRLPALEVIVLRAVTVVGALLWTEETKDAVRKGMTRCIQRVLQFI